MTLRKNCTDGILSSFRTRINSRPKNEIHRWTLHRYIGSPRIVSTRAAVLPEDKSAIMQVVVRLSSTQSLETILKGVGGREDTVTKGTQGTQDGKQDLVEYLVLQKLILRGTEKPWMVWGTTQESQVGQVLGEESPVGSPTMSKS